MLKHSVTEKDGERMRTHTSDLIKLEKLIMFLHTLGRNLPRILGRYNRAVFIYDKLLIVACISLILGLVGAFTNKIEFYIPFILLAVGVFSFRKNIKTLFKKTTGIELTNSSLADAENALLKGNDLLSSVKENYQIREDNRKKTKENIETFLGDINLDKVDFINLRFAINFYRENFFLIGIKSLLFSYVFIIIYALEVELINSSERLMLITKYSAYLSFFLGLALMFISIMIYNRHKKLLKTKNIEKAVKEMHNYYIEALLAGYSEKDSSKYALLKYKNIYQKTPNY
ncbi:MAG: hypothetical protein RBR97_19155 [Bacteroidales bacterium]|nr:hypothetical protein [Bacteroidales bacterium]